MSKPNCKFSLLCTSMISFLNFHSFHISRQCSNFQSGDTSSCLLIWIYVTRAASQSVVCQYCFHFAFCFTRKAVCTGGEREPKIDNRNNCWLKNRGKVNCISGKKLTYWLFLRNKKANNCWRVLVVKTNSGKQSFINR